MFCRKCGCKINTGDINCSGCGTEIKEIEYNGGFWNLVNSSGNKENKLYERKIEQIDNERHIRKNDCSEENNLNKNKARNPSLIQLQSENEKKVLVKRYKEMNRNLKKILKISYFFIFIFILIFAIQSIRFLVLSNDYKDIQNKYEILNKNYHNINVENEELRIQINQIKELVQDFRNNSLKRN